MLSTSWTTLITTKTFLNNFKIFSTRNPCVHDTFFIYSTHSYHTKITIKYYLKIQIVLSMKRLLRFPFSPHINIKLSLFLFLCPWSNYLQHFDDSCPIIMWTLNVYSSRINALHQNWWRQFRDQDNDFTYINIS